MGNTKTDDQIEQQIDTLTGDAMRLLANPDAFEGLKKLRVSHELRDKGFDTEEDPVHYQRAHELIKARGW